MEQPKKNKEFHANIEQRKADERTSQLRHCETVLKDNADATWAFAYALYQIKTQELWKEADCRSFIAYCTARLPQIAPSAQQLFSRAHVYRLAEWVEVNADIQKVSQIGDEKNGDSDSDSQEIAEILNENQARELAKAPRSHRARVLKKASKDGTPTAKKIREVVAKSKKPEEAEFEEIVKDYNGDAVPKSIAAEFQRVEREGKEHVQLAQQIKNYLENDDRTTVEARGLRETAKDLLAGLKTHLTKHVLCPKCKGEKCAVCSKRGFVSNHFATKGIGKKD